MFEFSKLCKSIERMDPETRANILSEKSKDIIIALAAITQNGVDGVQIYLNFILCSVAADGKLAKEEFIAIQPLLEKSVGKALDYEDAKSVFKAAGLDKPEAYKEVVDLMVDLLGLVSSELKSDIILICLIVCSIDGKISHKEKNWIKQLIR